MWSILKRFLPSARVSRPVTRAQSFRFRPKLERLEDRRVMSASALTVTATNLDTYWVGTDGNVYYHGPNTYIQDQITSGLSPGNVAQLSAGDYGGGVYSAGHGLYALALGNVYAWNSYGAGWQQLTVGGTIDKISAGDGSVYALSIFGTVDQIVPGFQIHATRLYDASQGPITDIASSGNDGLLAVVFDANVYVHGYSNVAWYQASKAGEASSLSTVNGNIIYELTASGGVHRLSNGQDYTLYDGSLGAVSSLAAGVSNNGTPAVFALGAGAVFENDGPEYPGWVQLTGFGAVTKLTADTSRFFVVTPGSSLWSNASRLYSNWVEDGYPGTVA